MTCAEVIQTSLTRAEGQSFGNNEWGMRHVMAWQSPAASRSIVMMYRALAEYADDHAKRYGSPIGEDYVLGPEWLNIAKALRGLLNGELGALDGGTLDALLFDMAEAAGFDRDKLDA